VVIGNGVTNIGDLAFNCCTGLTAITIPGNVASIGTAAFNSCSNLASVMIDSGKIGDFAFGYCGNLNTVQLGGSVANIGDFAFAFCTGLTGLTIPQSVNSIGVNAFDSCNGLANATINGGNIGDYAFSSCGSLGSVVIGNNVTNIGVGAFAGCSSLTNLMVSSSVTDIGGSAFSSCQSMINVTVGSGVSRIGSGAFSDDYNLQNVYFLGDPPMLADANGLFAGVNTAVAKIYFQPGTTGWSPQLQTHDGSFGVKTNQFGFNVSCDNNLLVVVEACTNLENPLWLPVATNLGPFYFSDSQWRNYPARFFRPRTPSLGGLPVVLWNPTIQTRDARFGVGSNQFGFTITGTSNIPVVVEACTNLAGATWTPLFTGTLTNGSLRFSDPDWKNYPGRFYRISSQ
jgi:BspA type Leucine rich repeat region (6 copies)